MTITAELKPTNESESSSLPFTPLAIANSFLERHSGDAGIEHMKLQKLVYFTHGWWLAINGAAIINERPQVWPYGPVFKSLYHVLKTFGHQPIKSPQLRYPTEQYYEIVTGDNLVPTYIDFVWGKYGHLTSFALSDMTHKPDGAWNKLASEYNYKVPPGLEIPDEYVRDEFLRMYRQEYADSGEASGDQSR